MKRKKTEPFKNSKLHPAIYKKIKHTTKPSKKIQSLKHKIIGSCHGIN